MVEIGPFLRMPKPVPMVSIEDEVLANLRRQPLRVPSSSGGAGTVADLNLPLDFLRRVADRVIQASFRERHRIVVGEAAHEQTPLLVPAADSGSLPAWLTVAPTRENGVTGNWTDCRPAVRGFRAPILGGPEWPLYPGTEDSTVAAAAGILNKRLAVDGLSKTVAAVARYLGVNLNGMSAEEIARLRSVGVPTDLAGLEAFTHASFEAVAENGVAPIGAIRVQLTGSGYYAGPGDGGSLDILRQLMAASPGIQFVASIEQRHVIGVLASLRSWTPAAGTRLVIVPEALPVSQWAQDNTKPGFAGNPHTSKREPMLLAPRWAGRGEDGGTFISGESSLMNGLSAAGIKISQSALLFEGGNLILVQESSGRRVLLIGEAEVHRNTALGLGRERVLELFRAELKADICLVLPAASFHIDLEVTVRSHLGQMVAFVPDTAAAVRTICRLAASRMAEMGMMKPEDAAKCAAGALPAILDLLGIAIGQQAVGPGRFPLSFANQFRASEVDSGVGNLQRVLFALDWIAAEITPPNLYGSDRHAAAYLRSLRRAEANRRLLQRHLRDLGWEVIAVPAISSETLSLNPINGVQDFQRYFMPAYGGFFETLDRDAADVFARALGPSVSIVPILTGETQRRGGGLHCAVCGIPAP